jgi:hypothetical protein
MKSKRAKLCKRKVKYTLATQYVAVVYVQVASNLKKQVRTANVKGLRSWVQANWVDIANPEKKSWLTKCGRRVETRNNYPKCLPAAKARSCQLVKDVLQYQEIKKLKEKQDKIRNLTS